MPRPKAVIFDLGGVLITSPLKAIEDYETENNIPRGYLNYAMSIPRPSELTIDPPLPQMHGGSLKRVAYEQTRNSILGGVQTYPPQKPGRNSIESED
jgi:hypothetical protein